MQKKKWTQPALIVLVKGEPQMSLLTSCKMESVGAGPNASAGNCNNTGRFDDPVCAGICSDWIDS